MTGIKFISKTYLGNEGLKFELVGSERSSKRP